MARCHCSYFILLKSMCVDSCFDEHFKLEHRTADELMSEWQCRQQSENKWKTNIRTNRSEISAKKIVSHKWFCLLWSPRCNCVYFQFNTFRKHKKPRRYWNPKSQSKHKHQSNYIAIAVIMGKAQSNDYNRSLIIDMLLWIGCFLQFFSGRCCVDTLAALHCIERQVHHAIECTKEES